MRSSTFKCRNDILRTKILRAMGPSLAHSRYSLNRYGAHALRLMASEAAWSRCHPVSLFFKERCLHCLVPSSRSVALSRGRMRRPWLTFTLSPTACCMPRGVTCESSRPHPKLPLHMAGSHSICFLPLSQGLGQTGKPTELLRQ